MVGDKEVEDKAAVEEFLETLAEARCQATVSVGGRWRMELWWNQKCETDRVEDGAVVEKYMREVVEADM